MPDGYKTLNTAGSRLMRAFVSVGKNMDLTAADDCTMTWPTCYTGNNGGTTFSPYTLTDSNTDADPAMAELCGDGIPTQLGAVILWNQVGRWSADVSDSTGALTGTITMAFASVHTSALKLWWGSVWATDYTVTFYDGSNVQLAQYTVTGQTSRVYTVTDSIAGYRKIVIAYTAISAADEHLRLVEVQFGDSLTIPYTDIISVDYDSEIDLWGLDQDASGVTIKLTNTDGKYDEGTEWYELFKYKSKLNLALTLYNPSDETEMYTVPIGNFYVMSRDATDATLTICAEDWRCVVRDLYTDIDFGARLLVNGEYIDAQKTLISTLQPVLSSYGIGVTGDNASSGYASYARDTDLLDNILQACFHSRANLLCDRYGQLKVRLLYYVVDGTYYYDYDSYGQIPTALMMEQPHNATGDSYNSLQLTDTDDSAVSTADYRTDTSVQAINQLILEGPKMDSTTAEYAVVRYHPYRKSIVWRGDLAVDLLDIVSFATRSGTVDRAIVVGVSWHFDGSLKQTLEVAF